MISDDLERVVAVAQSSNFVENPTPSAEHQLPVASAVTSGTSLAVVAGSAGVPSLAILDVVDSMNASQPGHTDAAVSADRRRVFRRDGIAWTPTSPHETLSCSASPGLQSVLFGPTVCSRFHTCTDPASLQYRLRRALTGRR